MGKERGAALITVLLVMLVLTALGIAVSLIMTSEDRISSRQDLQKLALYAAETGLRRGEEVLNTYVVEQATGLLSYASVTLEAWRETPSPPQHPIFGNLASWDTQHLGTYLRDAAGVEYSNVPVAVTGARGLPAFFSLFVRNNPTDPSGSVTVNGDLLIRLVAVGWVANSADPTQSFARRGVRAVKILEEEFSFEGATSASTMAQKNVNQQGTGTVVYGGT
ncbi:MAG: PilX N-terminal domain-containing pilus assembly protein [Thermoanaerobaculum sp.]|nr:PilX N-terminal domain-containing pilus assembly protein [Thermoanaerobaculum sp.]